MMRAHPRYHRPVRCRHSQPRSFLTRSLVLGPALPQPRDPLTLAHLAYALGGVLLVLAFLFFPNF